MSFGAWQQVSSAPTKYALRCPTGSGATIRRHGSRSADDVAGVVLDTNAWVLLVNGGALTGSASAAVAQARAAGALVLPTVAVLEVAQKVATGRLELLAGTTLENWLAAALGLDGLHAQDVTVAIAVEAYRLPGSLHRDPADRIVVATSRLLGLPLVTRDGRLLAYAAQGHVDAIAA